MSPKTLWRWMLTQTYWRLRLRQVGGRTILFSPILIAGTEGISLGNRCIVRDGARLEIVKSPQSDWEPSLSIGDNVNIEQGVHIVCQCSVVIEEGVSITPYCAIVDTYHPHDPPDVLPRIGQRLPDRRTHVRIGAGTFVGTHSVILPDVTIGRGCVIGAGSVVTTDIPDFCVAIGSPARVVKRFDPVARHWIETPREIC